MREKQKKKQLISNERCVYRAQLSPEGQDLYDKWAVAIAQRERSLTFVAGSQPDIKEICQAILYDQPFLYDLKRSDLHVASSGSFMKLKWDFYLSDEEAEQYDRRIYRELRRLKGSLPQEKNAVKCERNIHNLMLEMNIRRASDENDGWWNHSIAGPLVHHETVCEGAAMLFYLLCLLMGVPCRVLLGVSSSTHQSNGNHAWNMVKLGSQYAHVDVFWDMCAYKKEMGYSYDYFNLQDRQMRLDHIWDREGCPPCTVERWSCFAMGKWDVQTPEELRTLAKRLRDANSMRVIARIGRALTAEEAGKIIAEVYLAGRRGQICWRINEDQRVCQFFVKYI